MPYFLGSEPLSDPMEYKFSSRLDQNYKAWIDALSVNNDNASRRGSDLDTSLLDSNLKKHLAVLKKIKLPLTQEGNAALLDQMDSLKMEKFLPEIAEVFARKTPKVNSKDCTSSVEAVSYLHGRFPVSFTTPFKEILQTEIAEFADSLRPPKPEEPLHVQQWTNSKRLELLLPKFEYYTELSLAGLTAGRDTLDQFIECLLTSDSRFLNSGVLQAVLAQYRAIVEARQRSMSCVNSYLESLAKFLSSAWKQIITERLKISAAMMRAGSSQDGRVEALRNSVDIFKHLNSVGKQLSSALDKQFPEIQTEALPEENPETVGNKVTLVGIKKVVPIDESLTWESPEEKRLYSDLLDLRSVIDEKTLGPRRAELKHHESHYEPLCGAATDEQFTLSLTTLLASQDPETVSLSAYLKGLNAFRLSSDKADDAENCDDWSPEDFMPEVTVEKSSKSCALPVDPALEATFLMFRKLKTVEEVDVLAQEWIRINNSRTWRRTLREIVSLDYMKSENAVAPKYLARFLATVYPYAPEMGDALSLYILSRISRISYFSKRRALPRFFLRMSVFLCDLVKAGVCQPGRLVKILYFTALYFERAALELACLLLKRCGRFLYFNRASRVPLVEALDIIDRKRRFKYYLPHELQLVETALYATCWKESFTVDAVPAVQESEEKRFFDSLFYVKLPSGRVSVKAVSLLLGSVDYGNPKLLSLVMDALCSPWKHSAECLPKLASILADLLKTKPRVVGAALDSLLERVQVDLELNLTSSSFKRQSCMLFLGALLKARVLPYDSFAYVFQRLLTFGHTVGVCYKDPPDDYFRISLVVTLLSGAFRDVKHFKSAREQLSTHLQLFYRYILAKKLPLPFEVVFALLDLAERFSLSDLNDVLTLSSPAIMETLAAPSTTPPVEDTADSPALARDNSDHCELQSDDTDSESSDYAAQLLEEEEEELNLEDHLAALMGTPLSKSVGSSTLPDHAQVKYRIALKSGKKTSFAPIKLVP